MFNHTVKPRRHRRVIDQAGNPLEDTRPLERLRFAIGGRVQPDSAASWSSPADVSPVGRMPFAQRDMGMRRPLPPRPPRVELPRQPLTVRQLAQDGFAAVGRQLDEFVKVMSSGWRKLAAENDRKLESLDVRLAALGARVRMWAAEADGREMAAAYAEGGTEQVRKLTPAVLAEMDRRTKFGAA